MAYARYFKRGKKRYGPFYYKSVRMPDGRVKSLYLGKTLPKGETIETERRFPSRNVIIIALLVFLVIGATSFTGYIIFRPTLVYHTETLNMTVNTSQGYEWELQNLGELNSIKLSGSIIGNGSVKVYIESQGKRYLILDRSLLKHKNSTFFGFIPFVRAEDKLNTTQDIELNFVDICVDTCFLTGLNESSYKLVFEVENGTILEIMEINYMIVEIEAMEEKTEKLKEFREKVIKLLPEKDNFKMNEKPRFRFTTNESVEPEGLGMFVYGPDKKLSDMKANVVKVGEGEFEIEISEKRSFRPGLYKMRMNFKEGDETHYQEAEFLWGVLAINTHKSIYLENEKAFIGIAVLDDQGHMVCDANVTLEITDPKNEKITLRTSDGTIEVSPECEVYGVTNLPDYYAYYTVNTEGNYTMKLTAVTRNGVRSMTDTFAVKKHVDFDVERNGPTRIYPPVNYSMVFTIKPYRDYEGPVREYVPISFEITPQNGLAVTTSGETKVLEWNSVLTTGQTHQIDYEFDAPDISPYIFILGPLEIGDWKEAREWMIASDVSVTKNVSYHNNPDIVMKQLTTPESVIVNQANTIDVTINVTNGNAAETKGLNWSVNMSLWNTSHSTLNITGWNQTNISTSGTANFILYVAAGDIDADGDPDIVTGQSGAWVFIYDNPGNSMNISAWNRTNSSIANDVYSIDIDDMDNDGDNDVIVGAEDSLYIWENPDYSINISEWNQTNVTVKDTVRGIASGDMDNDGDADIAAQTGIYNDLYVFENPGNSMNISEWNYTNTSASSYGYETAIGDLDNDGDLDIISGHSPLIGSDFLFLWENPGNSMNISEWNYTIATDCYQTYSVALGDIDDDGFLDIISGDSADRVCVFENPSNTMNVSDWNKTCNYLVDDSAYSVAAADLDNDGDLDIISGTGGSDDRIYILENPGNTINISTWNQTNTTTGANSEYIVAADFDSDGDLDLTTVSGQTATGYTYLWENPDVSSTYITSDVKTFINQSGNATNYTLSWTPIETGNHTLMAIADNHRRCPEVLENNNKIILTVNVTSGGDGGPVQVGYCRNLDSANTVYELNQSINSNSSNCLNVTAGNITIDGKGYTLTYAITDTGTGINSNGYSQITIKNLIVTQTNTTRTSSPAIRIYDGQDNKIINNTIDVYGENIPDAYNYAIRFRNATNTTITNNTIITRTTCNYCHGIYLTTGSHNNTIEHNTITTIGDRSYGIYSVDSNQQTIYNNTIDMQDYYSRGISLYNSSYNTINQTTITADQQANVMRIEQYSSNNLITNSNMTNKYLGGWGIRIDTYSDDNNITNVNITAKYYAITLDSCQRTYIDNVYANGGELSAIYVITSNANDTRVNNSIMEMDRSTPSSLGAIHIRGDGWIVTNTNISTTGTYAAGIYLVGSNNFNGTNITIKTTGSGDSEAIRMSGSSTNNYFYDSTVSATNDDDVYFYSIGSGTLNLINTSIVDRYWYAPATHTLNVYWYLDAYVNYTNGSSMSGVTVAAWDKDSNQAFSESTGSSGKIPRQIVQEYTQNNTGSNYYSNYTVNASKTDYYTNTTSVNLTTNKLLYLTLTEIPLINITLNLDPNPANTNQNVSIYGHANQTDGNNVTNNTVNIYINDSMYYHNNNTGLLENTTVWWNTSWEYRKYIKVESLVSSTLTNTITMINFSTTSLISQGKMKSDCGDVRFTDSNGNELEYTLENSTCNSSNTVFWVWANLTGNANTTIFAYHGYSAASLKTDYTNLDSDLKLYMHFDKSSAYGESNTLVYDFSKNGNNGTCSGGTCPTWDSNGRFAGAFDFDGSDDYFAVADTDDLNTGGPWTNRTTILWFYANNVTKRQVLYEEGGTGRGFSIYIDDGKVFVGGWNDDVSQSDWSGTFLNTTISATTWYFVGFVLENGTDSAGPDRFRGYLDGSEFDSGDGRKMYAHAADIGIGAMNGDTAFHNGTSTGNGYYFNGSIDELRIYNRSLSLDEILAIYNSTRDYYVSNHILPRTDDYGNYNYTFNASTTGSYEIKVNTTYYGKYAEANDTLVVGAPPTASLGTNPVAYYYDSDGSIIFDLKCSDDVGVDTLQLWGNWSGWHANQTNSTPQNNTWWNVTVNGIPEGTWKWDAWCNDTSGKDDWSDVNRTFTVDTQPPSISGETREPDPTYHSDNATLNATISDPNLESVWISGNWSGSWVNYTGGITNVGSAYSYKLLSGNLSCYEVVGWRYYANDTSGNVGQGSLQVFTAQNHPPPNVTLEEPPNGTITADNTTFFDWSNATDDDGDSINYTLQVDNDTDFLSLEIEKTELTNSDYTLTDPEALEDDVYYWRVYSNDTCDTNLSDTWQFEVNPTQAVAVSLSDELAQGINWTISAVPIFNESADGNNGSGVTEYDVEVSAEGTNVDLYIKADDDLKTAGGDILGLGNETHSYNQSNNTVPSDLKFQLTLQYSDNQIGDNLPNGTKVHLKFFLSAPASQPAGTYNNTVMVKAVPYGYSP